MKLTFLGTGGTWGLPELNCDCMICRDMRQKQEKRERTALLFSGRYNLLIDCGPDIAAQLSRHAVRRLDGVLITHEHGDHYIGLDELFSYKRASPRGEFTPIPVYMTHETWETVKGRFGYLEQMEVIKVHEIPVKRFSPVAGFEVFPFKTDHGAFAKGSVGYLIKHTEGPPFRTVYTSDFMDLPEIPEEMVHPEVLILQCSRLNEPVKNTPQLMSFQRALEFIKRLEPTREIFLVHIGDGDQVPGDPANSMTKKREPANPLTPPGSTHPYPIPKNQGEWQSVVNRILSDYSLRFKCTVAQDGLTLDL
ncbi:MAG TPA: MBL fold metallo-hydrolase [Desulfatiglandales bacterium]|nr:MBL fold metallo-hydrolase [Desulfatiglandales bacterium]